MINEASSVAPREKMRANVRSISFEETREIVEGNAYESLTFITNEYVALRQHESSNESLSETRVFYRFEIRSTNFGPIFTFWSMNVKKFVYFVSTGGKIKVLLRPGAGRKSIAVDFLNPGDAQRYWYYASIMRNRRMVIELLLHLSSE